MHLHYWVRQLCGGGLMTATVTPLKAVPSTTSASVDLVALTRWELSVALYLCDWQPSDDALSSCEFLDMAASAADAVAHVGIDLIREVAALAEYAEKAHDRSLSEALWPQMFRAEDARNWGRLLYTQLHTPSLAAVADLIGRWRAVSDQMVTTDAMCEQGACR